MRILHTADWHIGKKLHAYHLSDDMDCFILELIRIIKERSIDVLLVSGDIFDTANPTSDARRQYYQSLIKLHQLNCKLIVTGGNHDSAQVLNAPDDLLKTLDIHVVGGFVDDIKDYCIPLYKNNEIQLVVLAIPFLRDMDFRRANQGLNSNDRIEIVQKGIENVYKQALEYAQSNFGEVPVVAMGHLFTAGAVTSESERDIQIGNQAMFHSDKLSNVFSYVALGHIHKPQKVSASMPMYYSGSPIPLSFSERKDEKRVLLIDTSIGFIPESIPIPIFRKLIRIKGNLDEIQTQLLKLKPPTRLVSLIEIILEETVYSAEKITDLEHLISEFNQEGYEIIHRKIQFTQQLEGTMQWEASNVNNLSELKPQEVFNKMLNQQGYDKETKQHLIETFQLISEGIS